MNGTAASSSRKSTAFAFASATGFPPTVANANTGPCTERSGRYVIVSCGFMFPADGGGVVTVMSRAKNGMHLPLYMYERLAAVGCEPSGLQSVSTNVSWLSPFALVPVQAKSIPCPISGHGAAPGKVTPSTSIPPPCSSYSLKICGDQ